MLRKSGIAGFAGIALALTACATTSFVSTWRAPEATRLDGSGGKVVALVMNANEAARRAAEDSLARELTAHGAVGVPMYSIAPGAAPASEAEAKAAIEKEGAVAAVVLRPLRTDTEVRSVPTTVYAGPYYRGFWGGYYGYGWGTPWGVTSTEIRTDTIVTIETLVYSLKQNRLVWAGQSRTTNPSGVDSLVRELVAAAVKELKRENLL